MTENVKSLLDDLMKSSALNSSDSASKNLEPERVPSHPTDSTVKSQSNILGAVPRNVRDLIPDPGTASNGTDSVVGNSTVTVSKENTTSFNNRSDGEDRISSVSEADITSNPTIVIANRTDTMSSTSVPPSPKFRDKAKPKPDTSPKQFKKPSNNFKNKPHVITNNTVSVEAIKPENVTEYSTDEPINGTLTTDKMANMVTLGEFALIQLP